ncbi:hypothetical protein SAMN02745181_1086 [Rubritalea squalenifaciens DSM 18772]|uniref:Uncharacterized protein n=1 Tax=Rubritalea squalenifaciens DSM 18772 TaxID=1123071 RepID=A0A1M6EPN1_9BACT|nr:hypothetical protein [Rubritalea squalenifaciens]SHI87356.1 hypothetical protein SAMN02745181_1086 [Rubritalea squalenifaciens DSM 18772]
MIYFAPVVYAQGEATQNDQQTIPDYSQAIDMLLELGFPDNKGYEYKTIKSPGLENSRRSTFSSSGDSADPPKLKGTGWLTKSPQDPSKQPVIFLDGTSRLYQESSSPNYTANDQPIQGKSSDANLLDDLKLVQKWLLAHSSSQTESHRWQYGGKDVFTSYFALACQAHRAGHTKEANQLIATLFRLSPSPESIIDGVITNIADAKLKVATQTFYKSKDWKAYHKDLISLQTTYSRGWSSRYALAMLIPKVEKRANGVEITSPSVEGVKFSPKVVDIITLTGKDGQKISVPMSDYYSSSDDQGLWLLDDQTHNPSDPPFTQLTQLGMEGFLALAALIGDDTLLLTVTDPGTHYSSYSYGYSYYNSDSSEIEQAEQLYRRMDRPKTRGEIALAYVKQCLPGLSSRDNFSGGQQYTDDEVKTTAIKFWKEHRNDSKLELVTYYLKNGNQTTISKVAASLLKDGSPESLALFENTVLESDSPSQYSQEVKNYTLKQRQKAKDFISKYKEALINELGTEKLENYEHSGQYTIMNDGGVEKFIEKLLRYTEGLKPSQLLVRLSRPEGNTQETLEQLQVALQSKPLGKYRSKFAYAAAKSDDVKAMQIITFLFQLDSSGQGMSEAGTAVDGDSPQAPKEGFDPPLSKFEAEDWLNLLQRTEKQASRYGEGTSIADRVGVLLENYANPNSDQEYFYQLYALLGAEEASKLYINRSTARLNGEDVPPLPSKDDVSEERLEEIVQQITDAKPAEVLTILEKLSVSEHLAWDGYLDENDPPEPFQKLGSLITKIDSSRATKNDTTQKAEEALKSLIIGKELNAETIQNLLPKLSENHQSLAGYSISISRNQSQPGYAAYLFSSSIMKARSESLTTLDKEISEKKHDHYVSLLLNPRSNDESNIILHSAKEITKDDVSKIVSTIENMNQGYLNAVITIESQTSIAASNAAREANKDEREAVIKFIKENAKAKLPDEVFEKMDLETLKQIKLQLEANPGSF